MKFTAIALASVALAALSSTAFAADLAIPAKPAPVVAAASSWDGAYIGANVGYATGSSDHINATIGDFTLSGLSVGGQVGYNFHLTDGVVAGVQGDLNWANITGSQTGPSITDTINWDGAVTARLGYDAGEFLPYVLGGVAFANSARSNTTTSVSEVHTGWTVGAGLEAKVSDNVSVFAEYRYTNFGNATYTGLTSTPQVNLTDSSIRAGLNYHF